MNNKGVTLVELLAAVIISSLAIGIAITLHIANQRIYAKETALIDIRSNVRGALDIIISDLREAGYNPTQALAPEFDPPIRAARSDWVAIRRDANNNGICEYGEERGYIAENSAIYRMFCSEPCVDNVIIAENVDYLGFRYFDAHGNNLTPPVDATQLENIRAVRVVIIGRTPREFLDHRESGNYPNGTPYNDRHYRCWDSTFVRIRNI